jgi:uncharacterized protein (TIGR00251 family)
MAAAQPSPFSPVRDGVRVRLRVQPRARRNHVGGLAPEAGGGTALRVAVTAPPEDGKANAAVVAQLAEAWNLPKSSLSVVAGTADRRKTIHLQGDPRRLMQALELWLQDAGTSA